jgi:B12-binding domain/radical SAM domain protein
MKTLLVFYYTKNNRYSLNALFGALETDLEILSQVSVATAYTKDELYKILSEVVSNYEKIVLLISFFTTQFFEVKEVIDCIRKNFGKKIFCVAGGAHSTGLPLSSLKIGFDLIVIGEAEEVFLKLVNRIIKEEDFTDLPSIAYLDRDGNLVVNKRDDKLVDLNKFPPITKYFDHYGPIEITRGCPYGCYFCQTPQIFGTKLRHRSIEKICEYVEVMVSKGLADVRFTTPSLFLYGSKTGKDLNLIELEELFKNVKKIIKSKGKLFIGTFPSEIRPEHVNKDTVVLLKKYADNDNVIIGVQSGSEKILKLINRRHTLEDVVNAVDLLSKLGFKVNLDFIFGLPYETEKDVEETIKFIDYLITKYNVRIHMHYFIPLPATKFQDYLPMDNLNLYIKFINKLKGKGIIYGDLEKQRTYYLILREIFKNYINKYDLSS